MIPVQKIHGEQNGELYFTDLKREKEGKGQWIA